MLVWAYLQWWYGVGWRQTGVQIWARTARIYLDFSVPILLATLFAPWRRIVSGGGGSLSQRLRAMIDNLVSRVVGLIVRLLALVAAIILMVGNIVLGSIIFVAWPLLPALGIALVIWGIIR